MYLIPLLILLLLPVNSFAAECLISGPDDLTGTPAYGSWSYSSWGPFGECEATVYNGNSQYIEWGIPDVNGTCKYTRTVSWSDCAEPLPPCEVIYTINSSGTCESTCGVGETEFFNCALVLLANGSQDGDEEGIDCGGTSGDDCERYCPVGTVLELSNDMCQAVADPDSYGNCPSGYTSNIVAGVTACDYETPAVLAVTGMTFDQTEDEPPPEFSVSFTTFTTSAETVVDNGDGTETASIDVIKLDTATGKQTTTTTSVTRDSGSTTGTGFATSPDGPVILPGFSGSITGETGSEENPENYDMSGLSSVIPAEVYDSDISGDLPEQTDLVAKFGLMIDAIPLFSALSSVAITTTSGVCSVSTDTPVYGQILTIDLCRWETFLRSFGVIFMVFVNMLAIFVVIRGVK